VEICFFNSEGTNDCVYFYFFLLCDASDNVLNAIDTLPSTAHYMTQFATGVMAFRVVMKTIMLIYFILKVVLLLLVLQSSSTIIFFLCGPLRVHLL
jgi:hypothetical protein